MSREYLADPLADMGVDYDENLADIHGMLDTIAKTAAVVEGAEFERSRARSCDNGGVLYDITCQRAGEKFSVSIDLSDDLFIASLWDESRPGRCGDIVFSRTRAAIADALAAGAERG
ncbi:hypothetical protein [Salinisphaera hydrothermalis]|uniref:Uncharacterized protein n=1 Tax=Salinisphaera hydrothermalis (strain C41B8) TaxID=1304275 RepID=A0A084INP3_SALHC|nr:hypothetical protein [Salinisphaera hydrothermalis]KEZ78327.1 hypothetical protein C41B8_05478 [Salinisphaera hydrothermalis C41B8]